MNSLFGRPIKIQTRNPKRRLQIRALLDSLASIYDVHVVHSIDNTWIQGSSVRKCKFTAEAVARFLGFEGSSEEKTEQLMAFLHEHWNVVEKAREEVVLGLPPDGTARLNAYGVQGKYYWQVNCWQGNSRKPGSVSVTAQLKEGELRHLYFGMRFCTSSSTGLTRSVFSHCADELFEIFYESPISLSVQDEDDLDRLEDELFEFIVARGIDADDLECAWPYDIRYVAEPLA